MTIAFLLLMVFPVYQIRNGKSIGAEPHPWKKESCLWATMLSSDGLAVQARPSAYRLPPKRWKKWEYPGCSDLLLEYLKVHYPGTAFLRPDELSALRQGRITARDRFLTDYIEQGLCILLASVMVFSCDSNRDSI